MAMVDERISHHSRVIILEDQGRSNPSRRALVEFDWDVAFGTRPYHTKFILQRGLEDSVFTLFARGGNNCCQIRTFANRACKVTRKSILLEFKKRDKTHATLARRFIGGGPE